MKTVIQTTLATLIAMAVHSTVFAIDSGSMRCNGGIVSMGATMGEVTSKCGQPASTTQRQEKKITDNSRSSRDRTIITVSVDDWIYNFGPNEFQYRVLFENGRVAKIESLDYGY